MAALRHLRRYGFLLGLIAMILLVHSLQAHKEYRYIFAVIPLWLLVGSDLAARLAARADGLRRLAGFAMAVFAAVSLVGILNGLPYQDRVYRAWSRETGVVSFLRNQDPIFPAYRYLSRAPGVSGIWQVDRAYYNLPGYYYLHSKIPFYDGVTGSSLKGNVERFRPWSATSYPRTPAIPFPDTPWSRSSAKFASCAATGTNR